MTDTEPEDFYSSREAYMQKRSERLAQQRGDLMWHGKRTTKRQPGKKLEQEGKVVLMNLAAWIANGERTELMRRVAPMVVWMYNETWSGAKALMSFSDLPPDIRFCQPNISITEEQIYAKLVELGMSEPRAREVCEGPKELYLSGYPRMTHKEFRLIIAANPNARPKYRFAANLCEKYDRDMDRGIDALAALLVK
jgi:hypothetical protein